MINFWNNVFAIFVGIVTVFVTTMALSLSLFSLVIFSKLIVNGPLDVLTTSTGPLVYALLVLFVAIAAGVIVASKLAKKASLVNAIVIAFVYAFFTFLISQSPSNLENPYPSWFMVSSYLILLPAGFFGHFISKKDKNLN